MDKLFPITLIISTVAMLAVLAMQFLEMKAFFMI